MINDFHQFGVFECKFGRGWFLGVYLGESRSAGEQIGTVPRRPFHFVLTRMNIANLGMRRYASERGRNSLSDASKISSKLDLEGSVAAIFFLCFFVILWPPKNALNLAFYVDLQKWSIWPPRQGSRFFCPWQGQILRISGRDDMHQRESEIPYLMHPKLNRNSIWRPPWWQNSFFIFCHFSDPQEMVKTSHFTWILMKSMFEPLRRGPISFASDGGPYCESENLAICIRKSAKFSFWCFKNQLQTPNFCLCGDFSLFLKKSNFENIFGWNFENICFFWGWYRLRRTNERTDGRTDGHTNVFWK